MNVIFDFILFSLITGGAVALLALVSRLTGGKVRSAGRYLLWSIVVIRFLVPVGFHFFAAPISIEYESAVQSADAAPAAYRSGSDALSATGSGAGAANDAAGYASADPQTKTQSGAPVRSDDPARGSSAAIDASQSSAAASASRSVKTEKTDGAGEPSLAARVLAFADGYANVIIAVYLSAAGAILALRLAAYNVTMRRLARTFSEPDAQTLALYGRVAADLGVRRAPKLVVSPSVVDPMLCGFFRRRVVIGGTATSGSGLEYVLRHELIHHKRADLYMKFAGALCLSLNFANPAAYFAVRRMEREMEYSCDERVLFEKDESERSAYGAALLEVVKAEQKNSYPMTTGFNVGERDLKRRFALIMEQNKKRKGVAVVALALAAVLIAPSVVSCQAVKAASELPAAQTVAKEDGQSDRTEESCETEPAEEQSETEEQTEAQSETEDEGDVEEPRVERESRIDSTHGSVVSFAEVEASAPGEIRRFELITEDYRERDAAEQANDWDDFVSFLDRFDMHRTEEYDDGAVRHVVDVWNGSLPPFDDTLFDGNFAVMLYVGENLSGRHVVIDRVGAAGGEMTVEYHQYYQRHVTGSYDHVAGGEIVIMVFPRSAYPGVTSVKAHRGETVYEYEEEKEKVVYEERFESGTSSETFAFFKVSDEKIPGVSTVYRSTVWGTRDTRSLILNSWDQYVEWCSKMGYYDREQYVDDEGTRHVVDVWFAGRPVFDRSYFDDNFAVVICTSVPYISTETKITRTEYSPESGTLTVGYNEITPAVVECVAGFCLQVLCMERASYPGASTVIPVRDGYVYLDENGDVQNG